MMVVDVIVRFLSGGHGHDHGDMLDNASKPEAVTSQVVIPHCVGCSDDPVKDLEEWHEQADREIRDEDNKAGGQTASMETPKCGNDEDNNEVFSTTSSKDINNSPDDGNDAAKPSISIENPPPQSDIKGSNEDQKLVRMGLSTAVAIGVHNFPEGLATFVAALDDPTVGAVLAIAIGIHNIPEGLCVALPVYYATGNRWKAFSWALLSGISEPIAALLGWAVLANSVTDEAYAILFGLVAGMMVIISVKELIPTAHRYDPHDTVVTHSFIGGMIVIALSLVLFQI